MTATEEIRMVPLAHLHLSPLNPRQECTEAEIDALAMSLRTVGLLQNLGGLEEGPEKIGVVAGGRRLRALKLLAQDEDGEGESRLVPIKITTDEGEARAWANTENTARMALNPADEIAAYGEMADRGAPAETIAKAFAVTVRHVKGRLKLAGMAPVILDALRAGEITLEVAAAYTVADDAEAQTVVFNRMQGSWNADNPEAIRRALKRDAEDASGLAAFVGREAYEAEGGSITEDLFGEDTYFNDVTLLNRLAEEKMQGMAEALKAEGWKWVDTSLAGLDNNRQFKMIQLHAERPTLTEAEADRYDELTRKGRPSLRPLKLRCAPASGPTTNAACPASCWRWNITATWFPATAWLPPPTKPKPLKKAFAAPVRQVEAAAPTSRKAPIPALWKPTLRRSAQARSKPRSCASRNWHWTF
jgi:ParB family chromosome partitioning protein